MESEDALLVAEYSACAQVANHIDDVRNVLTSFFLTLNGGVLVVLSLVVRDEVQTDAFGSPGALLAGVVLAAGVLGVIFTATVARLRRVQVERYRVANAILDHVLSEGVRPVVPFTNDTLPAETGGHGLARRTTGSYLWSLAIMLPTALLAGLFAYVVLADVHDLLPGPAGWVVALAVAAGTFAAIDRLYFALSALA
ncbi:MAG TPA: hypothetical protein VFI47_05830 [Acidimicrobiales bacterium]|nr:hypothetical protein [Acidimicrobiales bacterium]